MSRLQIVSIDLSKVISTEKLHSILKETFGFPDWYGCNWDAFWDSITAIVEMPMHLKISGWDALSKRLPRDAALLKECLEQMAREYPDSAPAVEYD